MTPERKQEIKEATKESPVRLTFEEEAELRKRNRNQFQTDVGAGRFMVQAKRGTRGAKMLEMKAAGYSITEIAETMGLKATSVSRVLERVYA